MRAIVAQINGPESRDHFKTTLMSLAPPQPILPEIPSHHASLRKYVISGVNKVCWGTWCFFKAVQGVELVSDRAGIEVTGSGEVQGAL